MTAPGSDPHDLARFIAAQVALIDRVRAELRAGRKSSHWMWFVFPQIGARPRASMPSARTRRQQRIWRTRCSGRDWWNVTRLVNAVEGSTAEQIFGHVDAMKLHSCMTLFAAVDARQPDFTQALCKYFSGAPDQATLDRISAWP
jgi:uncharacterized protein (DUF1810 family)